MSWFEHEEWRIYYEDDGVGVPVLVLPGFAGSVEDLRALREALIEAGFRVIAADLPGSGRSQPQPRQYVPEFYVQDAALFGDFLKFLNLERTHVVGFSDGGELALLMAATKPAAVRSVVAWGAAGAVEDPQGLLRQAMNTVVDYPIEPLQGFRDYLIAVYGEENARAMTQSFASALNGIVENGGDLGRAVAGDIRSPVLLIAGEHDFLATPELVRALADLIATADVRIVSGAGHSVHDSHADWLAETVLGWLAIH